MDKYILDLVIGPWKTMALHTAVKLSIFCILNDSPMNILEISKKTGIKINSAEVILNALRAMELVEFHNGKFKNSPLSNEYFVHESSSYLGNFVELLGNEAKQLNQSSKADKSHHGNLNDLNRTFIKAMHNIGMSGEAKALADNLKITPGANFVDAGGGSGIYSLFLSEKYPDLKITILDKKETLEITKEFLPKNKRIDLRECNIENEKIGSNLDYILLSDVAYEQSTARNVLKNAMDSLGEKGEIIIRGYYYDPESSKTLFASLFLMNQLMLGNDSELITLPELKEIMEKTGFKNIKSKQLTDLSFLVTASKKM